MTQGYVTYEPWRGDINNVRLHFESIVALAYLLDRKIAIPDHLHRRTYHQGPVFLPLHPALYFDLATLPITHLADIQDNLSVADVPAFQPDRAIIVHEDAPEIDAFACGREKLYLPTYADIIKLPPLLTPFYALVFSTAERRRQTVGYVHDNFRHYANVPALAKQVATSLGTFHAVQVRRTDFILHHPSVDIATILSELTEVAPAGSTLVIATDEPNRAFFDLLSTRYKVVFGMDVIRQMAPAGMHPNHFGCVEQNLCALAETFTGTRFSTFSAYITRLRGYHRIGDTRIRFTDGIHRHIRDTDGWPQFSWQPACRHGEALWGREFQEGWSF